ncbi:hypothetical protein NOJ16_34620 [Neorhizobium galegae]|nr:hypothetical protein [Neorhizobium galegae]MCQ1856355.1 hypothetical protein [Neorhizobium galegae]
MEVATGGWAERRGDFSLDRHEPASLERDLRHALQQHARVRMQGGCEKLFRLGKFHDAAERHHSPPVAKVPNDAEIMAYNEHAPHAIFFITHHNVLDLTLLRNTQPRTGFLDI